MNDDPRWSRIIRLGGCLILASLMGCSSMPLQDTGASQAASTIINAPTGKALVYIYSPRQISGQGGIYDIKTTGQPAVRIRNGVYSSYVTDPGLITISTDTSHRSPSILQDASAVQRDKGDLLTLKAAAGETYYLKLSMSGLWPKLIRVSAEQANQEIAGLKLQKN
jgi:hypothetical protein